MKWFSKASCRERRACFDCRTNAKFRASLHRAGWVDEVEFACPHGFDETNAQAIVERRVVVARKKGCGTCKPVVIVREP